LSEKVSVVIPTLGGSTLLKTINTINNGSIVPAEILVCIPARYASRVSSLDFDNVRIVETDMCGQVAQRAIGFKEATYPFVMQLDDDIHVDKECVKGLLDSLNSVDINSAVAPSFIDINAGKSVYTSSFNQGVINKIYYWLSNGSDGYKPGIVDKSCTSIGVNPSRENDELISVNWLAGGCVLHHKKSLVLDDFYPFPGKAFNEDIIHSHLLSKKGVKLWVNTKATCHLEIIPSTDYKFGEFLNNFTADYKSRKYFARITGRSILRMHIFYVAWFSSYLINWFKRFTRKSLLGEKA